MSKPILFAVLLLTLAGCAVDYPVTPQPLGGSRADGSVIVGFQHDAFQAPRPDWQAGLVSATNRCRAWGFRSADPFEGTNTRCERSDLYGTCLMATVTKTYQCLN
ncbi:MAG: YecR family lipoprotein [Pseudomonadota bacterium]